MERVTLPNAYYTVSPGKLVNAVTWLEMRSCPPARLADPLNLVRVTDENVEEYRRLFRQVGTPWLWSRAAIQLCGDSLVPTDDPRYVVNIARDDGGHPVGVVELAGELGGEIEIAYFGLIPEATGRGLGKRLMAAALDRAWASEPTRVWLHTCNFDHPSAFRFYKACGFTPYMTGFEIMDDPRLDGSFPHAAAPHIPLIER